MSEKLPRWNLPEVDFLTVAPEEVKASIVTRYEQAAGRAVGRADPVRLFLLTLADEMIQLRQAVNHAAQQNLLSYAQGDHLDALGVLLSVPRLPAAKAVTTLQFELSQALTSAFVIPAGFQVTNGLVTFETESDLTIPPREVRGQVLAHCSDAGEAGNGYLPGQITTIVSPLVFLESATNLDETHGGSDPENDADYAERIRLAPDRFSVASPIKAYEFHAKSVSASVIDVAVHSPSPGVVNVYPLLEKGELPNDAMLQSVQAVLSDETIRPLTDEVHTLAPFYKTYSNLIISD